jgi:hypothetical protein
MRRSDDEAIACRVLSAHVRGVHANLLSLIVGRVEEVTQFHVPSWRECELEAGKVNCRYDVLISNCFKAFFPSFSSPACPLCDGSTLCIVAYFLNVAI